MKPFTLALGIIILCGTFNSTAALADTLHVAVASNFTGAMKDIAAAYESKTKHDISLSYGSSGKFFSQIKNGAPFQVFFSADQAKPVALETAGLSVPDSRFTYAIGALALWSADANTVDGTDQVLRSGNFRKLAMANPKLAPYGAGAAQTLDKLGLSEQLKGKLVQGENISQTYQFVASGNAEVGFVALSQITSEGEVSQGSAWLVPAEFHAPISQDAVLLSSAADNALAKDFLNFVKSDAAKAIIHRYGYKTE